MGLFDGAADGGGFNPLSALSGLSGLFGGGGSTRVSQSVSTSLVANVAFNPSIGIATGRGGIAQNPAGDASGSPSSSSSSSSAGADYLPVNGTYGGVTRPPTHDLTDLNPLAGTGTGLLGSLDIPTILMIGGGVLVLLMVLKKKRGR